MGNEMVFIQPYESIIDDTNIIAYKRGLCFENMDGKRVAIYPHVEKIKSYSIEDGSVEIFEDEETYEELYDYKEVEDIEEIYRKLPIEAVEMSNGKSLYNYYTMEKGWAVEKLTEGYGNFFSKITYLETQEYQQHKNNNIEKGFYYEESPEDVTAPKITLEAHRNRIHRNPIERPDKIDHQVLIKEGRSFTSETVSNWFLGISKENNVEEFDLLTDLLGKWYFLTYPQMMNYCTQNQLMSSNQFDELLYLCDNQSQVA